MKCEHDDGDWWTSKDEGGCTKSFLEECPFCPKTARQILENIYEAGEEW